MAYTTNIEDPKQKPDQFELMRLHIERAARNGRPVYVLTMSRENYPRPEEVAERLKSIPGVYEALPVNGTIDCVMSGTEEDARKLAKRLHVETGEPIGCVRYDGENMIRFYTILKDAISVTREKNEPWHIYNPDEDSLDALLKKARSE